MSFCPCEELSSYPMTNTQKVCFLLIRCRKL